MIERKAGFHVSLMVFVLMSCAHAVPAVREMTGWPEIIAQDPDVSVTVTTKDGRNAVRVEDQAGGGVVLTDRELLNGVIEVDLRSDLTEGAPEGSRGFAGIAFRARPDLRTYEAFYIRPTNGRAIEQIRRNHATQYISHPDYPWHRLRREQPGHYESYVDLELGVWTHLRIEVEGEAARLFVNGSAQPVLVVNDLKLGSEEGGRVGFWIGSGTIAHFADLRVENTAAR